MRVDNIIVTAVCVAAVAYCLFLSVTSWTAPVYNPRPPLDRREGFADGLRSLAAALAAAFVAGVLAVGLGGRLVMRILAATSSDAQGLLTDADERVGKITFGGTVAFVLFAGLFAGLLTALLFLVVRRWLPRPSGYAGLAIGVLMLGTLGVSDPISPDNSDFDILEPTWLAVVLIVATALLFGVTFTAVAARLESGFRRIAYASYVAFLLFPVAIAGAVYVGVRTFLSGGIRSERVRRTVLVTGRALVALAFVAAAMSTVLAVVDITAD